MDEKPKNYGGSNTPRYSLSPQNNSEKIQPNYLKPSSSSCHDLCKYGSRQNSEEEERERKHFVPNQTRKKRAIIKVRSLSRGKIVFSEKFELIKEETEPAVEWKDIVSYNATETDKSIESQIETQRSGDRKMKKVINQNKIERKEGSSNDEIVNKSPLHCKTKIIKESPMEKSTKSSKSKSIEPATTKNEMTNKPVNPTKEKNTPKKKSPSLFTPSRNNSARRSHESKTEKTIGAKKATTKNSSYSSNSEPKEKILHVIEQKPCKNGSKYGTSAANEEAESLTPQKMKKILHVIKQKPCKNGSKSGTSAANEEAESLTPQKMKFRRGKAVEPPPEPASPRKLRFRRGRGSSENLSGFQIGKKSFRRKGSGIGVSNNNNNNNNNSSGQIVVLRHRETEEKKGLQGLFNSIIEETVSRLVKTRKSKVKALVGAFETVISLQDGKSVSVE